MRIKKKYQLGDYELIQYQILQTNITRTVWQTVRRITNEILGVKRLSQIMFRQNRPMENFSAKCSWNGQGTRQSDVGKEGIGFLFFNLTASIGG